MLELLGWLVLGTFDAALFLIPESESVKKQHPIAARRMRVAAVVILIVFIAIPVAMAIWFLFG